MSFVLGPALFSPAPWAHLLVHHALRELMLRTAATRGLDPDRVSFTETLRSARRSMTVTPGSSAISPVPV
ncbi:hypothetical protein [Streptomyces sp. HUAS TT20]|uniref:hypothetical protein n=1 Tax=Streptomyces sp. HUAS TT20 TaxID=3447509 RepID=UPI0021DAB024|nr:hypothetical protein [Streptomyces sp. HUAS 15-9]UXY32346.1 hypothetical protein N8I87_41545 [Streptomyces sp. HUAS 15-9]